MLVHPTEFRLSYGITVSELNVSASSNDMSCAGGHNGSATVNPSGTGPFEYVWMPGEFLSQSINHLFPGTYSVMVSNGAGCHTTEYITITEPPALQSDISGYDANCSGQAGSAAVHVSGRHRSIYLFLNTTPPALTDSISNLGAGTYIVLVRDANNCILRDTVSVAGATGFTASMQTTPATCNASDGTATVSVTGGSGDFSVSWTPSVNNGSSATINFRLLFCIDYRQSRVVVRKLFRRLLVIPQVSQLLLSSTNAHCEEQRRRKRYSIPHPAEWLPYEYLWQPSGDISASVNNLAPEGYIVRVSDYNNCPAYLTVNIGYDFAIPSISRSGYSDLHGRFTCSGCRCRLCVLFLVRSIYFWQLLYILMEIIQCWLVIAEGCENFDNIQVTTIACQSASRPSHSYHDSPIVYPNPAADEILFSSCRKIRCTNQNCQ